MRCYFSDICRSEKGNVTTLFALVSPILLGFAGLGVDAAYWYQSKTSLQIGNDITAISLARDYMANGPTDALAM